MSFSASQMQNLAGRAAARRAKVFGGAAQTHPQNQQLGDTQLRAAGCDETGREITDFGEKLIAGAVVLLPDVLGLEVQEGSTITHLPTGYEFVVETIKSHPAAAERRLTLRRLET
jgi:hypothetical protein